MCLLSETIDNDFATRNLFQTPTNINILYISKQTIPTPLGWEPPAANAWDAQANISYQTLNTTKNRHARWRSHSSSNIDKKLQVHPFFYSTPNCHPPRPSIEPDFKHLSSYTNHPAQKQLSPMCMNRQAHPQASEPTTSCC